MSGFLIGPSLTLHTLLGVTHAIAIFPRRLGGFFTVNVALNWSVNAWTIANTHNSLLPPGPGSGGFMRFASC